MSYNHYRAEEIAYTRALGEYLEKHTGRNNPGLSNELPSAVSPDFLFAVKEMKEALSEIRRFYVMSLLEEGHLQRDVADMLYVTTSAVTTIKKATQLLEKTEYFNQRRAHREETCRRLGLEVA